MSPLLVAMSAPLVLAGLEQMRRPVRRPISWRVFGLRSHGGFSVRPVLHPDEEEE